MFVDVKSPRAIPKPLYSVLARDELMSNHCTARDAIDAAERLDKSVIVCRLFTDLKSNTLITKPFKVWPTKGEFHVC